MVRNYGKKPIVQYDKKMQHSLQLINNGALIQEELRLNIVEIDVNQHSKS